MRNVDFKLGGNFLLNDTLKFIQEGNAEAVKAITDSLFRNKIGTTPFRLLDGFVITDEGEGEYSWTKGYVYVDGEIFEIPAQTTPITIDLELYGVYPEYLSDATIDPIVYKNGNAENIHFKNIISFKEIASNAGSLGTMNELTQFKSLHVLWSNMMNDQYILDYLSLVVYGSGWANLAVNTNWEIVEQPKIRRVGSPGNYKGEFKGKIKKIAQNGTVPIFTNITAAVYNPTNLKMTSIISENSPAYYQVPILTASNMSDSAALPINEVYTLDNAYYYI